MPKDGEVLNNPSVGIVNMIRSGYLALQLLPENSSAGKIVYLPICWYSQYDKIRVPGSTATS